MSQDKPVLSETDKRFQEWHGGKMGADRIKSVRRRFNDSVGKMATGCVNKHEFNALCDLALAALDHQTINEPPQALPGLDPMSAKEPRVVPFEVGPASGSPVEELVGRLEEHGWNPAAQRAMNEAIAAGMPAMAAILLKEVCLLCDEAAKALRALEAERTRILAAHKAVMGEADRREEYLQREADQLRKWLREALSGWESRLWDQECLRSWEHDAERISEIRSAIESAGQGQSTKEKHG